MIIKLLQSNLFKNNSLATMHFFIVLRNRDYVIIPPLLSLLTLD
jgi:hypothetical protein